VAIDKFAEYVARNPPAFLTMLLQREKDNPKFSFLKPGCEGHEYFNWKVAQLRQGNHYIFLPPSY